VGALPIPTVVYELFLTILTVFKAIDFKAHRSDSTLPVLVRLSFEIPNSQHSQ